jgi:hypothetical protein
MDNEINKIRKASEWPSKNATRRVASNVNLHQYCSRTNEARAISIQDEDPSSRVTKNFNININCFKNIKIITKFKNKNSFL